MTDVCWGIRLEGSINSFFVKSGMDKITVKTYKKQKIEVFRQYTNRAMEYKYIHITIMLREYLKMVLYDEYTQNIKWITFSNSSLVPLRATVEVHYSFHLENCNKWR